MVVTNARRVRRALCKRFAFFVQGAERGATRRATQFRFTEIVSGEKSARIENISLYQKRKMWHMIVIPSRPEGRSRSPRTRDGERWTWKRLSERRHARRSLLAKTGAAYGKDVWS